MPYSTRAMEAEGDGRDTREKEAEEDEMGGELRDKEREREGVSE